MAAKAWKRKNRKKPKIEDREESKKKRKRLTLRRAMRAAVKLVYKHLVELPETERERNIAALERAVAKKFKRKEKK